MARLLRRGGVLRLSDIVYSFEPEEAGAAVEAWLGTAPENETTGWTAAELAAHVRNEYSTFTWLLEPILEHAGFEICDRWTSENRFYAAYTCLRA